MSSRGEKGKQSSSGKKSGSASMRSHSSRDRNEDISSNKTEEDIVEQNDRNVGRVEKRDGGAELASSKTEEDNVEQTDRSMPAMRELIKDSKEYIEKLNRLADLANRELDELQNFVVCQSQEQLKPEEVDKELVAKNEETQKMQDDFQIKIDTMQQMNESLQREIESLKKENNRLQDMPDVNSDYDDVVRRLDRKENDLRRTRVDMEGLERQLDGKNDEIRNLKDEFRKENEIMQHNNDTLQREIESLKQERTQQENKTDTHNDYDYIKQRLECKENELHQTTQELEAAKSRLKSSMEETVTANNPNTTEPSDIHNQTELAERYKELHDNQWTDAYEILEKKLGEDEIKIISILLTLFTKTKEYCDQESELQMEEIQKMITQSEKVRKLGVPDNVVKYIKDCRKASSAESIRETYKNYQTWLRSAPFPQARYAKLVKDYTDECFEICWIMAIQDPPIVIASEPKHGETILPESYTTYTVTGNTVDFIVWPALLLHADGPVLNKGVVQATKTPPDGNATKIMEDQETEHDIGHTTVRIKHDDMLVSRQKREALKEDGVSIHRYENRDFDRNNYAYGGPRNYTVKDLRHERFSESHHTRGYDQTHMTTQMIPATHNSRTLERNATYRPDGVPYTPRNWDVTQFLYWKKQYGDQTAREMMGREFDRIEKYFSGT